MEAPQEIEGQDVVELDAVEGRTVIIRMGHDRPRALRGKEYRSDDDEIFAGLDLAWGQSAILGKAPLHRSVVGMIEIGPVEPQHEPHRKEGEAEADPGPTEGVGRRRVAD